MKIGIDFDNTIIDYGQLFHKYAINRFGIPSTINAEKTAVKAYFMSLPDGNTQWTELQGIVYGEKIHEATLYKNCSDFLLLCKKRNIPVCIISHKSEYPALGPKINLRETAFEWLSNLDFFEDSGFALSRSSVFFENTRSSKLSRIKLEKCTVFIDDLPEVFNEIDFPENVTKIHFSNEPFASKDVNFFNNWNSIKTFIFGNLN